MFIAQPGETRGVSQTGTYFVRIRLGSSDVLFEVVLVCKIRRPFREREVFGIGVFCFQIEMEVTVDAKV